MATVEEIFGFLCELAPVETQMDFDNAGFLVGHSDAKVGRAIAALDITDEVIQEAIDSDAQLIISHHPVVWGSLRAVTDTGSGRKTLRLAESGIAAICMHTNLDIAAGGVNDALMAVLGIDGEGALDKHGCGRFGRLEPGMELRDFLALCKSRLGANGLRYYDAGKRAERVAVMGGAGGDAVEDAFRKGCDTYVTADIKYHEFLLARELGLNLIDAGHYPTENPVIPVISALLAQRFPETEFIVSRRHRQIVSFA